MKSFTLTLMVVFLAGMQLFSADYYWVGGSGNWSDYANHWATTSGGATFHAQAPTQFDNVFFDANSFTEEDATVTVDINAVCAGMSWVGATHHPALVGVTSRTLSVYGSLTFIEDMENNFGGDIYFRSEEANRTLTLASQTFNRHVYFQGAGSYQLQDDLVLPSGNVNLILGGLDLNDKNVTASRFLAENTNVRTLNLRSSIITLSYSSSSSSAAYAFSLNGTNLTYSAQEPVIRFTGIRGYFVNSGIGLSFHDIVGEATIGETRVVATGATFNNIVAHNSLRFSGGSSANNITAKGIIVSGNNNSVQSLEVDGVATIGGNTGVYTNVVLNDNATITGYNNTFGTLVFTEGNKYTLTGGGTQFITNDLLAQGSCALPIIIESSSSTQSTLSKTAGSITLNRVSLQGINATGGAVFTANNAIDFGNNTGWIINPPATQNLYWVAGEGNWEDIENWSDQSGGQGGYCVPTRFDNVIFDENSFNADGQVVSLAGDVTGNVYCRDMVWTGVTNNPSLGGVSSVKLNIYGSLSLATQMQFNFSGDVFFESEEQGSTITSSGQSFTRNVYFRGAGEYTLLDDFSVNSVLFFHNGSLVLEDITLTALRFYADNNSVRTMSWGNSVIELTNSSSSSTSYALFFNGENLSFNAGTSLIRFIGARPYMNAYNKEFQFFNVESEADSGETRFYGNENSFNNIIALNYVRFLGSSTSIASLTAQNGARLDGNNNSITLANINGAATINGTNVNYGELTVNGSANLGTIDGIFGHVLFNGNAQVTGNNTFGNLELAAGNQYVFTQNKTQTLLESFTAEGNCAKPIIIRSDSEVTPTALHKESGTISLNYVSLQGISATGDAAFIANEATDLGNNSGWTINLPSPKNIYWVGGTGDWEDIENWSSESGGEGGFCVPSRFDNVFFDENSFFEPGQVVTISGDVSGNAYCASMSWIGATNYPTLYALNSKNLKIYGSLAFIEEMDFNFLGDVYFESGQPGNTVVSAGQSFKKFVYFQGEGEYTLLDDFTVNSRIYFYNGNLNLDNITLSALQLFAENSNARTLTLGNSVIVLTYSSSSSYALMLNGENLFFDAGTSVFRFTGLWPYISVTGDGLSFFNIVSETENAQTRFYGNNHSYQSITTYGFTRIYGANTNIASMTVQGDLFVHSNQNSIENLFVDGILNISGNDSEFGTVVVNGVTTLSGSSNLFDDLTMNGSANVATDNTYGTLTLTAGNQYTFTQGRTQTILENLHAEGTCAESIIIQSSSPTIQTTISKASGAVTLTRVNLNGVNATGGATFTANDAIDMGNNSGWDINEPATQNLYWVGGSGQWENIESWASTSGGEGGFCIPTKFDNVFFDENSFTEPGQTVTIMGDASANVYCQSMTWEGVTNNPTLYGAAGVKLIIYGSLTLAENMDFNFLGDVYFESEEPENTITSAGQSFGRYVYFQGEGMYRLLDDFATTGSSNILYLNSGGLDLNNFNLTTGRFFSDNTNGRTLLLRASVITILYSSSTNNVFALNGTNLNFDAGTSLIRLTGSNSRFFIHGTPLSFFDIESTASARITSTGGTFRNITIGTTGSIFGGNTVETLVINGVGSIYNNNNNIDYLVFGSSAILGGENGVYGYVKLNGNGNIRGDNVFGTLVLTAGYQYSFTNGKTQHILNDLTSEGGCVEPMILRSNSATVQTSIYKESGTIALNRADIRGVNAIGGAAFVASNSMDSGNNTGWEFVESNLDLYWVGGTGNWNDVNNWSAESGGEGGFCIPSRLDNAIFDENSFTMTGQTVTINTSNAECKDMIWTNATHNPIFNSLYSSYHLRIYGSMELHPSMDFAFNGRLYFEGLMPADDSYIVNTAGKLFNNDIFFNGVEGVWTLASELNLPTNDVFLNHGSLYTNSFAVNCRRFESNNINIRALYLEASQVTIGSTNNQAWYVNGANITLDGGTSEILLTPAITGLQSTGAGDVSYHKVRFVTADGNATLNSNHNFNFVEIAPNGTVRGGGHFEHVVFNAHGKIEQNNTFGWVDFKDNGEVNGNNVFGELLLAPGKTYLFQSGTTQTLENALTYWGNIDNPIHIRSSGSGSQAGFLKTEGAVNGNYIVLQDMNADGGAQFNVYNSEDVDNNTGWNFLEEPDVLCPEDGEVCVNALPFELNMATPEGGEYTGQGVSYDEVNDVYVFDPALAGPGIKIITYSVVKLDMFPDECTFLIEVLPLPDVVCFDDIDACVGDDRIMLTEGVGVYRLDGEVVTQFDPAIPGTYTLTYTETNFCGESSCEFVIHVHELPVVAIEGDTEFCENASAILTATKGLEYLWSTSETTQSIEVTSPDTYAVVVTDGNGCKASAEIIVVTLPLPEISCPQDVEIYCEAEPLVLEFALPAGGVYEGEGITYQEGDDVYIFTPSCEGLGDYLITYTFVNENGCENSCSFTISVVCNPDLLIPPEFDLVETICQEDIIEPLPLVSLEGITGTWSPELDNTQTTEYTFTPDMGQCAVAVSITIVVNELIVPSFDSFDAICAGEPLNELPLVSLEGITGIWSPDLDNTQTTEYTFTPDEGQCAVVVNKTIMVNEPVVPSFDSFDTICAGEALDELPLVSLEGITGTWSPNLDNTQTTEYAFAPDDGQCAVAVSMTIVVNEPVEPSFGSFDAICAGESLDALPLFSLEGITGSWSPELDNTQTAEYTFTPDQGQCATETKITQVVHSTPPPSGEAIQVFDTVNPTLADIVVEGQDIEWFASASDALEGLNPLPETTVLQNGLSYFAMQTVQGCRSVAPWEVTIAISTAVLGQFGPKIKIYPNPARAQINIECSEMIESIEIFNLQGGVVVRVDAFGYKWIVPLHGLLPGSYLVRVATRTSVVVRMITKE